MKSNILKSLCQIAFVSAALSGHVLALDKVKKSDINHNSEPIESTIKRSDDILTMQNGVAKKAISLHKGQKILGKVYEGNVYLTGKVIIKLKDDAEPIKFAEDYDLHIVTTATTNLIVFEPNSNIDLSKLLDSIKADNRVVRAELDKSHNKNMIQ